MNVWTHILIIVQKAEVIHVCQMKLIFALLLEKPVKILLIVPLLAKTLVLLARVVKDHHKYAQTAQLLIIV